MPHSTEQDDKETTSQLQIPVQTLQTGLRRHITTSLSVAEFSRRILEREAFKRMALAQEYSDVCSCNHCCPDLYLNIPSLCPTNHDLLTISLAPEQGAKILQDPLHRAPHPRFESLHLVDTAIKYFTRPISEMSSEQFRGLKDFHHQIHATKFLRRLDKPDCSQFVTPDEMSNLMASLNRIFFLDALSPPAFLWCGKHGYGCCTSCETHAAGSYSHVIRLDPVAVPICSKTSRAEQRIGILLHEMIHAFLLQFSCQRCTMAWVNRDAGMGHGRAWHRLAKGVEDVAAELLGLGEVRLGRWEAMKRYWVKGWVGNPSVCDLKGYGFW